MKKKMLILTVVLFTATVLFISMSFAFESAVYHSLAITFGTCFYHFAMRLTVGCLVSAIKRNRFDYTRKRFREKAFEKRLYEAIRIKEWKNRIPTFAPEQFCIKNRSAEELITATCQAEVVHEAIIVLSFIPVLFSIPFGAFGVFMSTSILSALIDLPFVLIQRYNRPRLIKLKTCL